MNADNTLCPRCNGVLNSYGDCFSCWGKNKGLIPPLESKPIMIRSDYIQEEPEDSRETIIAIRMLHRLEVISEELSKLITLVQGGSIARPTLVQQELPFIGAKGKQLPSGEDLL